VQIRDERPILGFKASGISASASHSNLLGLTTGNAGHTQFLMVDGSNAMSNDLNVGGNDITNVGLVNGLDITAHASRHLPNSGTDALTCAAPGANLTASTTNAEGVANSLARSDHSHAITTGAAANQTPDQTSAAGSSASLARADHVHNIPAAAPSSIGTSNTKGSNASFALSDHIHDHGSQSTATHHAAATTTDNGFMSSTDKTKLNALKQKAGIVGAASFTGTPRKYIVTFATPFGSANYVPNVIGIDARTWSVESVGTNGFTINSNANAALTGNVYWSIIPTGEIL
jgi:hypothetical protein